LDGISPQLAASSFEERLRAPDYVNDDPRRFLSSFTFLEGWVKLLNKI
jgi:hypothetical protein